MKNLMLSLLLITVTSPAFAASEIESLFNKIRELGNSDISCESAPDCETFAVGKKACGGPAGYLVVSANNPNLNRMSELNDRLVQLQSERPSLPSNCMMQVPPQVGCYQKQCVGLAHGRR